MKLIWLLLLVFPVQVFSQNKLSFDTEYFKAEDNWIVFPKKTTEDTYIYGFIYLDDQAGFTFNYGGRFTIDDNQKFIEDTSNSIKNKANIKYRLEGNVAKVAVLEGDRLVQLGLPKVPEWLSIYKENHDEIQSLVSRGFYYNHVGASDMALPLLEKAYDMNADFEGLIFELSFAYNASDEFKKAENVLVKAIFKDKKNTLLYKELVFALVHQNKLKEAEDVYTSSGLEINDNSFKAEMAFNIAQAYYQKKDKDNFKIWAKTTKKYCPKESKEILKYIDMMSQQI